MFNGDADRLVDGMCADIERQVGQVGEQMVRARLDAVLQNPTGYYESQITSEPDGGDIEITDGGVVYGPWLEGTGSRNRTTRFKGYATFRRVAQALDQRAQGIAEKVAEPWVGRMG
jgi:hypothetical protein